MLQRITLHLARMHDFPEGSSACGYEITAPLGADGRLDAIAWCSERERCRVRRFWRGEPDQYGRLLHRRGGAGGATWVIDYDRDRDDDDEACHRLGTHVLSIGNYVSIRDADGLLKTFRVADLRPVAPAPAGS
jgi:hypothetical protein